MYRSMLTRHSLFIILLASIMAAGCGEPPQAQLTLSPNASAPGEEITLTYTGNFDQSLPVDSLEVRVGKEIADLVAVQKGTIRFLVPELHEGVTEVMLQYKEAPLGKASFTVQPHPVKKLLFVWKNGEAQQVGEKLTNDSLPTTETFTAGKGMFYSVYSLKDELILSHDLAPSASGATGHEVFPDPKGTIQREKAEREGSFTVLVPNQKTSFKVKIFEPVNLIKKNKFTLLPNPRLVQQLTIQNH